MLYQPAFSIAALVLAILLAMASWSWLRFVKYPTNGNRDVAGRSTAWALGFAALAIGLALLSISG